jgi:hypothetical protein
MPRLHEVQSGLSENLFDEAAHKQIEEQIQPNGLSQARRLQFYRNNVFTGFTEALRATHPVVHKLVGDGFFRFAANAFIKVHPSRSGDLHEFGGEFSAFLADFEPAKELAYLPQVAQLEWVYHEVYHAADHPKLDLERLGSIPAEQYPSLRFILHPASRLLRCQYPVLKIWQVNQDDYTGDQTVDLDEGGIDLAVVRPDAEIEFHPLIDGQYEFLAALAEGRSLEAAAQSAQAVSTAFDLNESLLRFVETHTLVDFTTGTGNNR